MTGHSSHRDQLILRAVFFPRLMMSIGSVAFLIIGSGVWLMTGEFSGFSFFAIVISSIILISLTRSMGLVLVMTPHSISQRSLLTNWEVKSHELKSWELIRDIDGAGYEAIVVRSETGERSMSDWIVSGNRRYGQVLDWLRTHHPAKETVE